MIGAVGPDEATERLAAAIEDGGESALVGTADEVADAAPTAVVAVGEAALVALARVGVDAPVLPIDAEPEFETQTDDPIDVIETLIGGSYSTASHPILDVRLDGSAAGQALFDVTLVTTEPSRISEYGVDAAGSIDRFRADGVVVATAAGSRGYASAAGGPVLEDDVQAVVLVPIGAFRMGTARRVLEAPVTLTVEREEHAVSLLLDGREHEQVPPGDPVDVTVGGTLDVVSHRRGLEKL